MAGRKDGGRMPIQMRLSDDAEAMTCPLPAWMPRGSGSPSDLRVKRILDVLIALTVALVCAPLLLGVAVLVRLTSPGPVLFRQVRVGKGGIPFGMLKFRTMYIDMDDRRHRELNTRELLGAEDAGTSDGIYKLEDDPRITKLGGWLRRFSLDEFPQLFNVLRGDMSVVGPRPSLPWEVELFTAEQRGRLNCLPGLTGLWQVSGRNRLSMPQMLALDLAYTQSRSLWLDLWILLRTPRAVLFDRSVR